MTGRTTAASPGFRCVFRDLRISSRRTRDTTPPRARAVTILVFNLIVSSASFMNKKQTRARSTTRAYPIRRSSSTASTTATASTTGTQLRVSIRGARAEHTCAPRSSSRHVLSACPVPKFKNKFYSGTKTDDDDDARRNAGRALFFATPPTRSFDLHFCVAD
jgi:hypothetical protein